MAGFRFGLVAAVVSAVLSASAQADPRPFTFTNDAYPMGKGDWEYEQWVTYEGDQDSDDDFERLSFRHEFEFGLADNIDLAIYLPEWQLEDTGDGWDSDFQGGAVETIVYLSNPVTDFVGIGLYNEVKVREDELEFEHKLIVHKDIDKWTLAYNFVLETELEHTFGDEEEAEIEGVIEHTFGASYRIASDWGIGGEAVVASEYEDWSEYEGTTVYAGPVVTYQGGRFSREGSGWWATVTPLFQLTDDEDAPNLNFRLIVGVNF